MTNEMPRYDTDDDDVIEADVDNAKTTTEEGDITGETYIEATQSGTTGIASGGFVNIFDGEAEDNLNEFNASQQFVPNETAIYTVIGTVVVSPGADQDRIEGRVRNTTDSSTLVRRHPQFTSSGTSVDGRGLLLSTTFTAGKAYEFQVLNADSTWNLDSRTRAAIFKGVVHP